MKQELNVTAHRVVTEYDKDQYLLSTIELRVPAEELEFMGDVLEAMRDDKDVRSTLVVRDLHDGEPRRLSLKLKASKMKDFVPVAVFTKFGSTHDNLTELFSTGPYGDYELLLLIEVIEAKDDQDELDFEGEREPVERPYDLDAAVSGMVAEGCPHCPDLHFDPAYLGAERHLALCNAEELCQLLESIGIDPTRWDDPKRDQQQDMAEQRKVLLSRWEDLNLTVVLQDGEA
ncbi:hypothetical protein [Deinococcus ruber]|uniref:Uncharacterized protein n=1 Tax=Deinococcus ruber TaxID=1848197 RepID=A0A918BZU1_9DEIO|nr:hypothetical protein [Deinococcus ruber]GGR00112.1 hypothetical protein GCM10008957_11030 [Deinococcus ruber]